MTSYTIEQADMAQLVALVLGMRPTDEAVVRIASTIGEGWLSGTPLTEIAHEGCGVGVRLLGQFMRRLRSCREQIGNSKLGCNVHCLRQRHAGENEGH